MTVKAHLITGYSKNRKANDAYFTPTSAILALLKKEKLDKNKSFLDPCTGSGRFPKAIKKFFGEVDIFSSDLYDYGYGDEIGIDFAENYHIVHKKEEWFTPQSFDYICTNPPYDKKSLIKIIKNCKKIAKEKVILLLRLSHLAGKERYKEIFLDKEFPLEKIYVFVKRLQFGVKDKNGKIQSPTIEHAFFVFTKNYVGSPKIDWIYLKSKKERSL